MTGGCLVSGDSVAFLWQLALSVSLVSAAVIAALGLGVLVGHYLSGHRA